MGIRRCCHRATRRKCTHLLGASSSVEREGSDRGEGETGSESSRSWGHGHYVSGSSGTGKSHLAQAIGQAAILQGHKVLYRQTHILLEEVGEATLEGRRKQYMESISSMALLIIDDFGMRKLPQTAAEDLLEIVMRRYERTSTLLTSNRPLDDWGKLLADVAAVGAMLDRLLHHGHVLKCGPKSWRTKMAVAD